MSVMGSEIAGCILAGGQGQRLGGVRKAKLRVAGIPLLERTARVLVPSVSIVLVSTGPSSEASGSGLPPGTVAVPDGAFKGLGPAAGVLAAAAHLARNNHPARFLLTLAVDTPFAPADFVARLTAACDERTDAVFASFEGRLYPTNALWRLSALAELAPRAEAGRGPALMGLVPDTRTRRLEFSPVSQGNPFANVNEIADLLRMAGRGIADGV